MNNKKISLIVAILSLVSIWYWQFRIDYTQLQSFLANKRWKEADIETSNLILKLSGRALLNKLFNVDFNLQNISCQELNTIDQLWVKYSENRFGFTIQESIWQHIIEKRGSRDFAEFDEFTNRVGWSIKEYNKTYSELTFAINAPEGHLPSFLWMEKTTPLGSAVMDTGDVLFFRSKQCQILKK
jgi:hypothetical protein